MILFQKVIQVAYKIVYKINKIRPKIINYFKIIIE